MNNFIQSIISEGTVHEFKSELNLQKPKSWLKTVSAFANSTTGGTIYIGITDVHQIVNVNDIQNLSKKISESIVGKMDPVPIFHLEPVKVDNKKILILEVKAGNNTPYYFVDSGTRIAFIRMGEESIPAPKHILHSLILKGMNQTYDSIISSERIENHTFLYLKKVLLERANKNLIDDMLISYELVTRDGFLTNAGVLLSDQCNLIQSRVFATRWNGLDKTTRKDEAFDSKEFKGNILYLLEETEKFVYIHNQMAWHKGKSFRTDKPSYNEDAIHEILVNSLIHRDYTMQGSEIHVNIFDDRSEVYNPGGMFNGLLLEDIDPYHVESSRRNPIIADVFNKCKLMEREGSGIKNILRLYKDNPPKFFTQNNSFIVTLRSMNAFDKTEEDISISSNLLTEQEKVLIEYLKKNNIESFDRNLVKEVLGIQKSRASQVITSLTEKDVLIKIKRSSYKLTI